MRFYFSTVWNNHHRPLGHMLRQNDRGPVHLQPVTSQRASTPMSGCSRLAGTMTMDSVLQARQAGATWALCFFLPRYPTDLVAAARHAKALGMRVAAVTDQASDLVNGFSDTVLLAATSRRLLFTTYAAPMVLSGILVQALCDADPQRTRSRLREHERMVSKHRLFHGGLRGNGD